MPQPQIQYSIVVQDKALRVVQWGLEGPAILLLHGLASRAEVWRRFALLLADQGYRCLAIDTPGHGLSWKGADFDYTAAGHAALLEAVIDALGEDRVDVVASSLGGLHASALAARTPERLNTLTLVSSVGLKAMTDEQRDWAANTLSDMSRDAIAQRFQQSVGDPALFDRTYIEETYLMNNSPGAAEAWQAIAAYFKGSINDDLQTAGLAALDGRLPILLLWGRDDPIVPYEAGFEAVKAIPGAVLAGIAETKHLPQIERPAISVQQVLRLVRQDPALKFPKARPEPAVDVVRHEDVEG